MVAAFDPAFSLFFDKAASCNYAAPGAEGHGLLSLFALGLPASPAPPATTGRFCDRLKSQLLHPSERFQIKQTDAPTLGSDALVLTTFGDGLATYSAVWMAGDVCLDLTYAPPGPQAPSLDDFAGLAKSLDARL